MSLIVDIPMPVDCHDCPFMKYYGWTGETICSITHNVLADHRRTIPFDNERPDWCTLKEINK